MSYGLQVVAVAGPVARHPGRDPSGKWVASFDPDAHGGLGSARLTDHPADAVRFETPFEALAYWQQTSTVRPIRPDGRPNRPLTAFTVAVERLPDA